MELTVYTHWKHHRSGDGRGRRQSKGSSFQPWSASSGVAQLQPDPSSSPSHSGDALNQKVLWKPWRYEDRQLAPLSYRLWVSISSLSGYFPLRAPQVNVHRKVHTPRKGSQSSGPGLAREEREMGAWHRVYASGTHATGCFTAAKSIIMSINEKS